MSKSIEQILGYQNLTGIIQDPRGGIPADILPPAFTAATRPVAGNTATYFKVSGNRQVARAAHYGSPSKRRDMKNVAEVPVRLVHTIENIQHSVTTLTALRQFDNPAMQRRGEQLIAQEVANFRQLFNNLRLAAIYSTLVNGKLWFDSDGNLLPSSSGAAFTVDFQIPAENRGSANGIISASWASSNTKILNHLKALKRAARKSYGAPLVHAFYGSNILDYLLGNDQVKELLKANAVMSEQMKAGDIPDGFARLKWHPIDEAFFEDASGVNQDIAAADALILTPEPSPEWWEILEGSYEVPTSLGEVTSDLSSSLGYFQTVQGMFSYGVITHDPPGIKQVAGDTFLPLIKAPSAVFQLDVTP